jgi:hypothetical protein
MSNELDQLEIFEDDFDLFVLLEDSNKIEYLYDTEKLGPRGAMLKQIAKYQKIHQDQFQATYVEDIIVGEHRICIAKYDDVITFNSDSLSLINQLIHKIWSDGAILLKDQYIPKTNLDNYKYFKAFQVIKINMPICEN